MTKKKDQLGNVIEDPPNTSSHGQENDISGILHKKHKKHKHKKHKRKKGTDLDEEGSGCGSPGTSSEGAKPALKLKIRIGGQTLGEKSVIKSEIPDANSDESTKDENSNESAIDEEEAWLVALESGRLEEVDEELKKMKDPNLMTARQRALLESKSQKEKEESIPAPLPQFPQSEMTEEMIERRLNRAKKRKQQADEKREKDKQQTIERLLKKTDAKVKVAKKLTKKVSQPKISYIANPTSAIVCLPPGFDYPLLPQSAPMIPETVLCGAEGCSNVKKYSCSRTGTPLCSLACYKRNLQLLAVMPLQTV